MIQHSFKFAQEVSKRVHTICHGWFVLQLFLHWTCHCNSFVLTKDKFEVLPDLISDVQFPSSLFCYLFNWNGHGVYSCVQLILYMPFVQKSSTHSYPRPHTLPTHPAHTNLTPSDLHTQLINTFTDPPHTHTESPPLHHLPSAQNGYLENVCCCCCCCCCCCFFLLLLLLLQKLTQSMHLDNKLDWVNQHSFQGIHFVFLLGLSLFISNFKYLKLS